MRRMGGRKARRREEGQAISSRPPPPKRSVATGRQIRYARVLGLLICAGGFVVMGLGWAGTARVSCTDCQIPYLLSGGAAGLGLVVFGVTILVLAQLRAEGRRTADRLERLEQRLAESRDGAWATPRSETPPMPGATAPAVLPTPESPPLDTVAPEAVDRARAG